MKKKMEVELSYTTETREEDKQPNQDCLSHSLMPWTAVLQPDLTYE